MTFSIPIACVITLPHTDCVARLPKGHNYSQCYFSFTVFFGIPFLFGTLGCSCKLNVVAYMGVILIKSFSFVCAHWLHTAPFSFKFLVFNSFSEATLFECHIILVIVEKKYKAKCVKVSWFSVLVCVWSTHTCKHKLTQDTHFCFSHPIVQ